MGSVCDESDAAAEFASSGQESTPNESPRTVEPDERSIEGEDRAPPPNFEVPEQHPSPEELIQRGQYLVDCPSWLAFLGEDKRLQYSNHFISRNDKIWELISTEIRYVDLLVMIRDVFLNAFPPRREDSLNLNENLFPHLDEVLKSHTLLLCYMLEAHNARPDHITNNLGQCFIKALTEDMLYRLIEAYGALMFVQSSLTESLNKLKANRSLAEKLSACEREPRTKRRNIPDCYMIIIQRWTKIETLLSGIISDTIVQDDSTELDDLNTSRRAAQGLLLGAQQKMTDLVHAEKLRYFADNLKEDWADVDSSDTKHKTLLEWMKASDAKLINYDKLAVQGRKEGGKPCNIELHGVALKDCFFLLRQDPETGKFSLYRDTNMPPILIWTKHFGYFRDQAGSPLTFIILMDSKNAAPTLSKFVCSTHDEVARWQKVFTEGFDNFGKVDEPEAESMLLQKNTRVLEAAEERRKRQEEKLALISQLTIDIFAQWDVRNTVFRTLFVDEGLTASASRSNSGCSTNREQQLNRRSLTSQSDIQQVDGEQMRVRNLHERFMKSVMRLANLCGEADSTCLSRSASDAADRRPSCSSITTPTPDTSGGTDSSKKRPEKEGVTSRIKPKSHHMKSSQRNSMESQNRLSNLLRTGSRRRADGSAGLAASTDFQRDYLSSDLDRSEGTSESSLTCLATPALLIADIQELARSLLENYDGQHIRCLELEKDNLRLKTEVEITGGQTSINMKRELECLRSLQKKTEDEQNAWNSHKQKEEARLEREDQKLKNLAKDLGEKQKQYEEDSRTLQELIDLHARRGVDVNRLRGHGSNTNLYATPQPEFGRNLNSYLSHGPSSRSEGDMLLPRCLQAYTEKGHRGYFLAPTSKDPGERRTVDRASLPPSTKTGATSNESSRRRHGNYPLNLHNYPTEHSYYSNTVPSRPPAGPHSVVESQRHMSTTSSTLGSLPTKLASKSRSSKSSLRH
ncbi:Dbl y DH domain [Echinococcus multilocularis]|uniref:Dbl y DH domain n=1 Tax=Echinococcus multilocularis TaxID=6211 RepID=A0A068Y723_ECHMU|nr:Dbl y DH domain [Echinococcus multilocularis]